MVSITQLLNSRRLSRKWRYGQEFIVRELNAVLNISSEIYFPYSSSLVHPAYDELKLNPPCHYTNQPRARLFHFIQGASPDLLQKKPHIIEVIDHALSVLAPYRGYGLTCKEYIQQTSVAEKIYKNDMLKKIIFISNGQFNLFKKFFSDKEILNKCIVIPLPWSDNIIMKKNVDRFRTFLFIASNYWSKGVPVVLDAWDKFSKGTSHKLILVSHDIPQEAEISLPGSILLIKKAPLPRSLKRRLYAESDVVIATTLTDGITPIEAKSFGRPVIVFRSQHSYDFISRDEGVLVDTPINIYDDGYGLEWETNEEYFKLIESYYSCGNFKSTIQNLVEAMRFYEDPLFVQRHSANAVEAYNEFHRVEIRNKKLMEVYNECM